MKTRLLTTCVLVAVGAALSACGGADPQSKQVDRANFADWPLTSESGTLKCEGSDGVGGVTIEVDGKTYAVNGSAKGDRSNADIAPIWAADKTPGLKKDIGPLIQEGLRLCK